MATIPTGTILAAQRCRHQLKQQQKLAVLRSESVPIAGSPICSPDCTPPASPRKPESHLSAMNLLNKLSQLRNRSYSENDLHVPPRSPRHGPSKLSQLLHYRSMSSENDLTTPPMSPEPETPHPNVTPVLHHFEDAQIGISASGQTQSLEASHHTSSITSMT